MNDTLIITDVDLKDLELHRQQLGGIIEDDSILSTLTPDQQDALQGIAAMLDAWSDKRYHAAIGNIFTYGTGITHTELTADGDIKATLISGQTFNSFEPGE
jgi:hypothetical protein